MGAIGSRRCAGGRLPGMCQIALISAHCGIMYPITMKVTRRSLFARDELPGMCHKAPPKHPSRDPPVPKWVVRTHPEGGASRIIAPQTRVRLLHCTPHWSSNRKRRTEGHRHKDQKICVHRQGPVKGPCVPCVNNRHQPAMTRRWSTLGAALIHTI